MIRLRQIGFNALAALSALLAVAILGVCAKSFMSTDLYKRSILHGGPEDPSILVNQLLSQRGYLCLARVRFGYGPGPWPPTWKAPTQAYNDPTFQGSEGWHRFSAAGGLMGWPQPVFYWHIHTNAPISGTSAVYEQSTLILSYWPMLVLAAVLPALKIYTLMQARRIRIRQIKGLCMACGYDLRATPEDQSRYPLNYASRIGAGRGH
jgi:hypothetical protein